MYYSGKLFDILEDKLRIFYRMCDTIGIDRLYYHLALPHMLIGDASRFYYSNLAGNHTFNDMLMQLRLKFETFARQAEYASRWRTLTMQRVVAQYPEKSKLQCYEILVFELERIHRGVTQAYWKFNGQEYTPVQENQDLRMKLIDACANTPECENAFVNLKSDYQEVVSQFRDCIYIRSRIEKATAPSYLAESNTQRGKALGNDYWDRDRHDHEKVKAFF